MITDTAFTPRHIPLILHFHGVLGPDWPIIFFTSQAVYDEQFKPGARNHSAVWQRAVDDGRVQVRIVPEIYDLTIRKDVNRYLTSRWLWDQLEPATHVLVFQADAMLCANAPKTVDDFLQYDFIGATLTNNAKLYNGGLSLRNRTMIMEMFNEGHDFAKEIDTGVYTGGEDVWFSRKFEARGANLPSNETALQFSCEYNFHMFGKQRRPVGYHKVHKAAPLRLAEIAEWCPEISLSGPGKLAKPGKLSPPAS
ncbi:hypothetical protein H072_3641 [Dactylellina haptotyla CBS 200.50]|uniref:DUF5672 domain-containing protein n=1 Tax=Dactylellina haptotyla (strain CBS 200.50) TaxID=1284197 RepID=S8AHW0_DACHA|nr:hypothetical protein H072_3641 [Dactylellina haptotyla CBS 200.50]